MGASASGFPSWGQGASLTPGEVELLHTGLVGLPQFGRASLGAGLAWGLAGLAWGLAWLDFSLIPVGFGFDLGGFGSISGDYGRIVSGFCWILLFRLLLLRFFAHSSFS